MKPSKRQSRDDQDGRARDPDQIRQPDDDITRAGAGTAPVSGDDVSPLGTDEEDPARPRDFRRRLAKEIEHPTPQEHPDGSAPLLDRLTQDLDPSKDA